MKKLSAVRGFTLIELLVVISIIGILSSFLLANFVGVRQRVRDGVRKSDLRHIQSALEFYRSDKGKYPNTNELPSCGSPLQDASEPPVIYMTKIPCDPLGSNTLRDFKGDSSGSYGYVSAGADDSEYSLMACIENKNDKDQNAVRNGLCPLPPSGNNAFMLRNP